MHANGTNGSECDGSQMSVSGMQAQTQMAPTVNAPSAGASTACPYAVPSCRLVVNDNDGRSISGGKNLKGR